MWFPCGLPGTHFCINNLPDKGILNRPHGAARIMINSGFVNQREASACKARALDLESEVLGPCPGLAPRIANPPGGFGQSPAHPWASVQKIRCLLRPENRSGKYLYDFSSAFSCFPLAALQIVSPLASQADCSCFRGISHTCTHPHTTLQKEEVLSSVTVNRRKIMQVIFQCNGS